MRQLALGLIVVLTTASLACSAGRVATWERGIDLSKKGDDSALQKVAQDAFKDRLNIASLQRALATWEQAAQINAANIETYVMLSRGYYFLADGHYSFDAGKDKAANKAMLENFEKGVAAAERGLIANSPDFAAKMKAKVKVIDALDALKASDAPLLYWYAVNLGKWARAKGLTTILFWKGTVKKAVEKVLALAPTYWYGAADRYLGALYSILGGMTGGDKKKSKVHFDASLKAAPNYFATKVLMAEHYYGKRMSDRKSFDRLLDEVIKGDANADPAIMPEQKIEQRRAADVVKRADDIF